MSALQNDLSAFLLAFKTHANKEYYGRWHRSPKRYYHTLHRLQKESEKEYRTWTTECEWIYGPAHVGKTQYALQNYDPNKFDIWDCRSGRTTSYTGQEVVFIDNFKGKLDDVDHFKHEIDIDILLHLVDKWPYSINSGPRQRKEVQFLAKKVIIASLYHPRELFDATPELDEFCSRITITHIPTRLEVETSSEGRTFHSNTYRTWMTECEWIYGPTGVGKTHYALQNYNPDHICIWHNYNYTGQEVMVIDNFTKQFKIEFLLKLVDKWPYMIKTRGRRTRTAEVQFVAKKIIVTSIYHPREVYDSGFELDELCRRITIKHFTSPPQLTPANAEESIP